jgi:hypothetical protein
VVLIGYWPLNESSGSTAYDHSGNENHGTINDGGDSTVPGANGMLGQNAYSFDGGNDFTQIEDASELDITSDFTVTGWIYPSVTNDRGGILVKGGGNDNYMPYQMRWGGNPGDENIFMDLADSGASSPLNLTTSTGSVPAGKWTFISASVRGNTAQIYLNGVKAASKSFSLTRQENNKPVYIGKTTHPMHFPGKISGVRLYNHALTSAEVQYLYTTSQRGRQVTSSKSS